MGIAALPKGAEGVPEGPWSALMASIEPKVTTVIGFAVIEMTP